MPLPGHHITTQPHRFPHAHICLALSINLSDLQSLSELISGFISLIFALFILSCLSCKKRVVSIKGCALPHTINNKYLFYLDWKSIISTSTQICESLSLYWVVAVEILGLGGPCDWNGKCSTSFISPQQAMWCWLARKSRLSHCLSLFVPLISLAYLLIIPSIYSIITVHW